MPPRSAFYLYRLPDFLRRSPMFGFLGNLLGGGLSAIGSIFGAQQSNDMQMRMVQQQEDFQERMSNTAYQRASKDMQAAGLNPMMMFGSGSAASTPSGAIAPMTSGLQGAGQALSASVNSALSGQIMSKTVDKMTEEIAKIKADVGLTQAQTRTEAERPDLTYQQKRRTSYEADTAREEVIPAALRREVADVIRPMIGTTAVDTILKGGFIGKHLSDVIGPATDIVSSAMGARRSFHNMWKDRVDRGFE